MLVPGGHDPIGHMPNAKPRPLISSVATLRALAAGITILSLAGMTGYAADHVRNNAAPLQPPAAAQTQTAAPATTRTTTGRIQLSIGVQTTTVPPITKTHRS